MNDCEISGWHEYKETYYGYECVNCDDFIPYGSEPWITGDYELVPQPPVAAPDTQKEEK